MNFYSELLNTNILICKTKDGFVASTELDYVKYKSESMCEGIISNMTIAQFGELHSKFKPEISFVDQKINVVYDIGFIGAKIMFILHKENLTSEKEMLIKYKKHSEIISRLEHKIQSMQEAKDISSTIHVVKIVYHKEKGMYFNVPDLIKDKFYKIMHTFYNCSIYPQHIHDEVSDVDSVPWQNKYDSIDELFANSAVLYYITNVDSYRLFMWIDLVSYLSSLRVPGMSITIFETAQYRNQTNFISFQERYRQNMQHLFHKNKTELKDQYEELCEKYNVKEICVAQIHISQPFNNNYKIYGTGEAGEKKYYIDMIENGHNLPRKTLVPTYNINTKLMENSIVVWNVQNEPGANY